MSDDGELSFPGTVPTVDWLPNRVLLGEDLEFVTRTPRGRVDRDGVLGHTGYTIQDTRGCSTAQIIELMGLGDGHRKFGLSGGEFEDYIGVVGSISP